MSPKPITQNTLFYGDNLPIMREYIPDESVDLIYLDPPFNSNRSYNVLFKDEKGTDSEAQISAFDDSWHWGLSAETIYNELVQGPNQAVGNMIEAMRKFIGRNSPGSGNQMMAYLVMMAARLMELHRVLKPTGSIYLHCDPTANHYLKIIMDTIFGVENFKNEIIWKRTSAHNDPKRYGNNCDYILYYGKGDCKWNQQYSSYSDEYISSHYGQNDDKGNYTTRDLTAPDHGNPSPGLRYLWKGINPPVGRTWSCVIEKMIEFENNNLISHSKDGMPRLKRYLTEMPGVPLQVLWNDIPPINSQSPERLGYQTQKPLALLERIILASSDEGDTVLDPFSGCGTAIAAAQKLNRKWIGIDITYLAIAMHKGRLKGEYDKIATKDYVVIGEPADFNSARALAIEDRYQFQWWALSLINARPIGGQVSSKRGKKGSDQGIDGVIPFVTGTRGEYSKVVIQVKSGGVKSGDIRDLHGVIDREKDAPIGVFVTLEPPTREMSREAVSAGFYTHPLWNTTHPKIQILTIEEILNGKKVDMPPLQAPVMQTERVTTDKKKGQKGFEFLNDQ